MAAVEKDLGLRFLHVRMTFAQPKEMHLLQKMATAGLSARFEIMTDMPSSEADDTKVFRN